jgi:hypothetical protein
MWSTSDSASHRSSIDTQTHIPAHELDSTQKSDSTSEASDSDSEITEEGKVAGAEQTKRELIMPWHIQDTAPQPTGKPKKHLIVELSSEDVSVWMDNRGTNPPHTVPHSSLDTVGLARGVQTRETCAVYSTVQNTLASSPTLNTIISCP